MKIHVVQRGDTLWRISQRYGATTSQIVLANQLEDPNILIVGQSLIVPETNREYIVQPGIICGQLPSAMGQQFNCL